MTLSQKASHSTSHRTKDTENFPVGSLLVAPHLRPIVHAYYTFARAADDISDSAELTPEEKVRQLDEMDAQLIGASGDAAAGDGPAAHVREVLASTSVPIEHCRDLLVAFKRDSLQPRTKDWTQLMDYCRYSANPVGRFLLDLHGESKDAWAASDALCSALQVLNHLQDCRDDFLQLDRVYLPQDWLERAGTSAEDLRQSRSTPALMRVIRETLEATRPLIREAAALPGLVKDAGLRRESAVIVVIAERLADLLAVKDPVAERVQLSKLAFASAAITGLGRSFFVGGR